MNDPGSSQSQFADPRNVRLLARTPLFENLPEDELHHLAKSLRVREIPPNTLLFHVGLPAQDVSDRLLDRLIKLQGEARQDDDITVVAIRSSSQD